MQHAAVVPDDDVAGLPAVLPGPRWLTGVCGQLPEQASRFLQVLADDVAGVPTHEEVGALCGRVDAHEWMHHWRQMVEIGLA